MFTPLFPDQASTLAPRVDALYFFLVGTSAFFTLLIACLVVYFAIRYRRRAPGEVGADIHGGTTLEIVWSVIPLGLSMVMFAWGASVYFSLYRPPDETLDIYVVGKQWMWKFQHLDGQQEINELHIPINRAVKLTMTSQDVIHDLFIPAFRTKADVIPGRYTTIWFQATRPGRFHLFCAEYCGTQHSGMIGEVSVMEPAAYEAWLSGGGGEGSLASAGEKLFQSLACNTCHQAGSASRGPLLDNLFGKNVALASGETVAVDEGYLRESILNPQAKVTAGYQPIMPTFQGLVSEEGLLQLIEYIKSLKPPVPQDGAPEAAAPPAASSGTQRQQGLQK
jgi:cytochrome c oxidase subunit 2